MTTAPPPDPDPERTPDLEAGGGVSPGATPPAAPQTSGLSEPQPSIRRRHPPREIVALIAVALFVLAFATTAVLLVLDMFGAFA
jgi:hypothetical protein